MDKYLLLTFVALIIAFCSCDDDNDGNNDKNKLKISAHLELLGLKDNVSELSQASYDELSSSASAFDEKKMTFDKDGRLTSYITIGESLSYYYDSDKLIKVVADYEDERGQVEYQFIYGGNEVYAPCPVDLGGLSMYLIKGISKVEVKDNPDFEFSYICDGKRLTWIEEFGGVVTTRIYNFRGAYPENEKRTIAVKGDEEADPIENVEITFSYGADGELLTMDESADLLYGEKTNNHFSYQNGKLIKEEVYSADANEMMYIDEYTYDENGYFIKKSRKNGTSEQIIEAASYIDFDKKGNWTVKSSSQKAPWGMSMVTSFVKRDIKYF